MTDPQCLIILAASDLADSEAMTHEHGSLTVNTHDLIGLISANKKTATKAVASQLTTRVILSTDKQPSRELADCVSATQLAGNILLEHVQRDTERGFEIMVKRNAEIRGFTHPAYLGILGPRPQSRVLTKRKSPTASINFDQTWQKVIAELIGNDLSLEFVSQK